MTADLVSDLRELLADVLALSVVDVPADASTDTLEDWDSLKHLDLVMALEHRFATQFSPDDVVAMRSVAGIVSVLRAKNLA